MKKSFAKKILALVMCFCTILMPVASFAALPENDVIEPQYIGLADIDNVFNESGSGLYCFGYTSTSGSYSAGVTIQLQQYDGKWTTVESMTKKGSKVASASNTYYPDSGYSYRLVTIHQAYDSSGTLVEIDTLYSNSIWY